MDVLLTQIILAARNSEGEDTIWVQMLVLVILAVSLSIFSLSKAKTNKFKEHNQQRSQRHRREPIHPELSVQHELLPSAPTAVSGVDEHKKVTDKTPKKSGREKERDLHSGMELLGLDFLLSIVENTNGGDSEKDVAIRKINFKELLRRGKLNQADSNALKTYAVNKGNLYGKDIQCEAMKNLAERTTKKQ